jgi:hypothetical protein
MMKELLFVLFWLTVLEGVRSNSSTKNSAQKNILSDSKTADEIRAEIEAMKAEALELSGDRDKDNVGPDEACGCPTMGSTAYFLDLKYRLQEPDAFIMMTEIYGRDWLRWINRQLNSKTRTEWVGNSMGQAQRKPKSRGDAEGSFADWGPLRLNRIDYQFVYGGLVHTDNGKAAPKGNQKWNEAHYSHKAIDSQIYFRTKNTADWHVSRTREHFIQEFQRFGAMLFYHNRDKNGNIIGSKVFYAKREGEDFVTSPLEGDPAGERLGMNLPPIGREVDVDIFAGNLALVFNDEYTAPAKENLHIAFLHKAQRNNCGWCASAGRSWSGGDVRNFIAQFFNTFLADIKDNFDEYTDPAMFARFCETHFKGFLESKRCKYNTREVL